MSRQARQELGQRLLVTSFFPAHLGLTLAPSRMPQDPAARSLLSGPVSPLVSPLNTGADPRGHQVHTGKPPSGPQAVMTGAAVVTTFSECVGERRTPVHVSEFPPLTVARMLPGR